MTTDPDALPSVPASLRLGWGLAAGCWTLRCRGGASGAAARQRGLRARDSSLGQRQSSSGAPRIEGPY
ncbi:hypothetical protein [Halochromatium glycolicum]|uniref:Uncharacterized protein n=1 Tax=Halochromatium glycolicum TaxID=85075 RepID=A0AAJ0U2W8_9GAMM|nr:hypothetical protein [Halochromatium glycolicum]MBK1704306.1 hypothetical protein [Halochromatium glycolicum]